MVSGDLQRSEPSPLTTSAVHMPHCCMLGPFRGGAMGAGVAEAGAAFAPALIGAGASEPGVRIKAILLPSGDQRGDASLEKEGASHFTGVVAFL